MRRNVRSGRIRFFLVASAVAAGPVAADDWPQFRGGVAVGRAGSFDVPLDWAPDKHLAWRTAIPGSGWSQPIVVGGRLYVTTAVSKSGGRPSGMMGGVMSLSTWGMGSAPSEPFDFRVLRLDPADGRIAWSRSITDVKPKFGKHASNTFATETPCGDASGVYACFAAAGILVALDHDGNRLRSRVVVVVKNLTFAHAVVVLDGHFAVANNATLPADQLPVKMNRNVNTAVHNPMLVQPRIYAHADLKHFG